jgi:hypothetical protein
VPESPKSMFFGAHFHNMVSHCLSSAISRNTLALNSISRASL